MNLRNTFWLIFTFTLIIKLCFAYYLPLTNDEAYFFIWGSHLDYGYYDHPPMIGWWLWFMLQFSDALWWLRLPMVLVISFIGWVIYRVLREKGEAIAVFTAAVYLLLPINLLAVFIVTDTPLILWMFLSVIFFSLATQKQKMLYFVLAGVFLGLAVLSKYFSALLGFAYLVYFIVFARTKTNFMQLMVVYFTALPFLLVNIYWNYNHCWTNYLFNFVNRHGSSGFSWNTAGLYLLMWVWVLPPLIYYAVKCRHRWKSVVENNKVLATAFFVPFLLFTVLSFVKTIGLHWIMGFLPILVVLLGHLLSEQQLRSTLKFIFVYSMLHALLLIAFLASPASFIKPDNSQYINIISMYNVENIANELKKYEGQYRLSTVSYSKAAVIGYHLDKPVSVIGGGTYHARQDDMNTDYREWDGDDVLVFVENKARLKKFENLFRHFEYKVIKVSGVEYNVLLGQGFSYQKYHQQFLKAGLKYYQIPDVLPVGECYYFEKYFPEMLKR